MITVKNWEKYVVDGVNKKDLRDDLEAAGYLDFENPNNLMISNTKKFWNHYDNVFEDTLLDFDLTDTYKEWREISEEMLKDGHRGSIDCGEQKVREDFSNFAGLEEEITFKDMLKLEEEYKK